MVLGKRGLHEKEGGRSRGMVHNKYFTSPQAFCHTQKVDPHFVLETPRSWKRIELQCMEMVLGEARETPHSSYCIDMHLY